MAGIYLHIPFCRKACHYCNFHFSTSTKLQADFVQSLLKEILLQKDYLHEPVSTIYFGGGTPSILEIEELRLILQTLRQHFSITEGAEITLEANPDDITTGKLREWKAAGITRLSMGAQSFAEADLVWMNRAHNAQQALQSIQLAQAEGFHNITIDLIYGTPTLSDEQWKLNVQQAIDLGIPHLSCYALTVEPKTALEKLISKNELAPVDNQKQAHHFELLMQWMQEAGYEHYEISNFAKPGYRSRHNSSYWQGVHYLGLGPSAHSFNGSTRQWNVSNNALYIKSLEKDQVPFEIEYLTPTEQVNEYLMTALRTMEGVSLKKLQEDFGEEITAKVLAAAKPYEQAQHLVEENDYLKTTTSGKLLADGIASDLFQ
ncbi:radical SAM family heme chaperone HemW [Aridibaculum aurantiacum]|uniref:radical SAM family heme chaperone HemW n=1 Tax=Aridibaculum aurantiacum TaxID=2810307 RepID=UPI001A95DDBE|nr:radical SAM family heme chaperone HemW [Aridibaculum aurantiacum]